MQRAASTATSQRNVAKRAQVGRSGAKAPHQADQRVKGMRKCLGTPGVDIADSIYILQDMNNTKPIQNYQQKIATLKDQLLLLDRMRPGSLSRQYNIFCPPRCPCHNPQKPKRNRP